MTPFHVGMKVVCISDDWVNMAPDAPPNPVVNEIYEITAVSLYRNKHLVLTLLERPSDWRFTAENFRPVVETKTSIEIFQKMLAPKKVDEHEPA